MERKTEPTNQTEYQVRSVILKRILLENFRNYKELDLSFHPKTNVILGKNGQGKTNLLEAIYIVSLLKPFRSFLYSDLLREGEKNFSISAWIEHENLESTIQITFHKEPEKKEEKYFFYNNNPVERISSLLGQLKVVLFWSKDLDLVYGSPSARRRYLDLTLSLSDSAYFRSLKIYHKALRQRNRSLREFFETPEIWDPPLIEEGTKIIQKRVEFLEETEKELEKSYSLLGFSLPPIGLTYSSSLGKEFLKKPFPEKELYLREIRELWKQKLQANRDRERRYKQSLFGPHRDDFLIELSSQKDKEHYPVPLSKRASQGEIRGFSWAFQFATSSFIERTSGKKPILLLDDVLSELDREKQEKVLSLLENRQVFLTSTQDPFSEPIKESIRKNFWILEGSLTQ